MSTKELILLKISVRRPFKIGKKQQITRGSETGFPALIDIADKTMEAVTDTLPDKQAS